MRIKDQRESVKQLITGYRKEWLESESTTSSHSSSSTKNESIGYSQGRGESIGPKQQSPMESKNNSDQKGESSGKSYGDTSGETHGRSQANVPIHKTFTEVSSITFESFDEWAIKWGQRIRRLRTGEAFTMFPNSDDIREVRIDHQPIDEDTALRKRIEELLQRNYESGFFISAQQADNEVDECRRQLLAAPPLRIDLNRNQAASRKTDSDEASSPFP